MSASSSGDTATYEFSWETEGSGDLLMMALPHHVDTVFNVLFTNVIYNTIKGDAVGVVSGTSKLVAQQIHKAKF